MDIGIVKEKDVYLSIKRNNVLLSEAVNMVDQWSDLRFSYSSGMIGKVWQTRNYGCSSFWCVEWMGKNWILDAYANMS